VSVEGLLMLLTVRQHKTEHDRGNTRVRERSVPLEGRRGVSRHASAGAVQLSDGRLRHGVSSRLMAMKTRFGVAVLIAFLGVSSGNAQAPSPADPAVEAAVMQVLKDYMDAFNRLDVVRMGANLSFSALSPSKWWNDRA
jgi:hypothetical protein